MTATTSSHVIDPLDEQVDMLVSIMDDADRDLARKVLQYFNGDIDKAADALLGGQAHTLDFSAPPGNLGGYNDYSQPAPRQFPTPRTKTDNDLFITQHLVQTRLL